MPRIVSPYTWDADERTHSSWASMMYRCYKAKETSEAYKYYRSKGIIVCERWHAYENFVADMGLRPCNTTLDRKRVFGNYEPDNCRWATPKQQTENRAVTTSPKYSGYIPKYSK